MEYRSSCWIYEYCTILDSRMSKCYQCWRNNRNHTNNNNHTTNQEEYLDFVSSEKMEMMYQCCKKKVICNKGDIAIIYIMLLLLKKNSRIVLYLLGWSYCWYHYGSRGFVVVLIFFSRSFHRVKHNFYWRDHLIVSREMWEKKNEHNQYVMYEICFVTHKTINTKIWI